MKLVFRAVLGLLGLVAIVYAVGATLTEQHTASVSRVVAAGQETVWTAVSDFEAMPNWRTGLDTVERDPDSNGLPAWTEVSGRESLSFQVMERVAPTLFVSRIVGEDLFFGGTWRIELEEDGSQTRVTITENGEVYNPVARFISRFVIGHEATMTQYLDDLDGYLAAS